MRVTRGEPCPHNVSASESISSCQAGSEVCRQCSYNYHVHPNSVDCEHPAAPVSEPEPEKRGSILLEAHDTINGERQDQYGNPEDSFKGIAMQWQRYMESRGFVQVVDCDMNPIGTNIKVGTSPETGPGLTAADVAHMMILFKLERELNSPKRDNLLDMCGYAAIKADILENTNNTD